MGAGQACVKKVGGGEKRQQKGVAGLLICLVSARKARGNRPELCDQQATLRASGQPAKET